MRQKFPKLNNPCTELDLIRAFNHNSIYGSEKQDKRNIKTYLDVHVASDKLKTLKGVNEYVIDSNISTLAHLVSEGYELAEGAKSKLDRGIDLFFYIGSQFTSHIC